MPGLFWAIEGKIWPPKQITTRFSGKTVIVTGANTGVGYATALKYAELDASTVILAVRTMQKGEAAKEKIEAATGQKSVVQRWELDMESWDNVDAFAQRVDKELPRVDAVVLNAGLLTKNFTMSKTGWEVMLQVQTLSTALLSILLLPKLKASHTADSPAHLEIVSSTGHIDCKLQPAEKGRLLRSYNQDRGLGVYQQHMASKVFMMWMTRELAKRVLNPDGSPQVIMNDICPGACRSDVARDFNHPLLEIAKSMASLLLFRPAESGARTMVGATLLGPESHGRWWSYDKFPTPGHYITSDEGKSLQKDMWTEVTDVLRDKNPRVQGILDDMARSRKIGLTRWWPQPSNSDEDLIQTAESIGFKREALIPMAISTIVSFLPNLRTYFASIGVGGEALDGLNDTDAHLAGSLNITADIITIASEILVPKAEYLNRLADRNLAINNAGFAIKAIDKQIAIQTTLVGLAQTDADNQQKIIDMAGDFQQFLKTKWTNVDMYSWLQTSLQDIYYQTYTITYDIAKKAERVYRFELGLDDSAAAIIDFGYWDVNHDGALAGEKLYQGILKLQTAYDETRRFDFEINKSISLHQLDLCALFNVRSSGSCDFSLPEIIFDIDFPGHYRRRIKSVSLSFAGVSARSIAATLTLTKHRYRLNSTQTLSRRTQLQSIQL